MSIINSLVSREFRTKDEIGKMMSRHDTIDALIQLPLQSIKTIQRNYMRVWEQKRKDLKEADVIFRACCHKAGVSHYIDKNVRKMNEIALQDLLL